jgi:hypothetical protein
VEAGALPHPEASYRTFANGRSLWHNQYLQWRGDGGIQQMSVEAPASVKIDVREEDGGA